MKNSTITHLSCPDSGTQETGISVRNNFIAGFILTLAFLFPVSCTELSEYDALQVQSALHDSLLTTTESWNVEMVLMEEGLKKVALTGAHAITYNQRDRRETRIDGPVYIQTFDSTGTLETEAWSKKAVYFASEGEFELYDSVRVRNVNDRFLYGDFLKWQQRNNMISSPHFVIIVTPTDSISGRVFSGKTDLSSYIIEEPRGHSYVD